MKTRYIYLLLAMVAVLSGGCLQAQSDTLGKYPFLFYGDDFPELGAPHDSINCTLHKSYPYFYHGENASWTEWGLDEDSTMFYWAEYGVRFHSSDTIRIVGIASGVADVYSRHKGLILKILDPEKLSPVIVATGPDTSFYPILDSNDYLIDVQIPGAPSSYNTWFDNLLLVFFENGQYRDVVGDFYISIDQRMDHVDRFSHVYEDHEPPYALPPKDIILLKRYYPSGEEQWIHDTSYRSFPLLFPIIEPRCEPVEEVRVEWDSEGCLVAAWDSLPRQEQWVVALNVDGQTLLDTVGECRWRYCGLPVGTPYEIAVRSRCTNLRSFSWSRWHRPIDIHIGIDPADAAVRQVFTVRPNPSRGQTEVLFGEGFGGGRLEVLSVDGRTLEERAVPAGAARMALDLRHIPAGAYLLRLTTPAGVATQRLVLSR